MAPGEAGGVGASEVDGELPGVTVVPEPRPLLVGDVLDGGL
jgi:hypothetical protein